MVHLPPLPGSPEARGMDEVLAAALHDARVLADAGFDGVLVENFGDQPFLSGSVDPITVAAMARVVTAVRDALPQAVQVGVNVLRNDARSALAVAAASGAGFVRVNVHCGVRATDQGVIEGRAWETIRLRESWGGQGVAVWADVDVKHSTPMGLARSIEEEAEELVGRGMADAVIVTGGATGAQVAPQDLVAALRGVGDAVPVIVGSGVNEDTVGALLQRAAAVLVGTSIKEGGVTHHPVDPAAAARLVAAAGR